MISIIISYYRTDNFENLIKNIKETCGENFEIIGIFNPRKYSIAEAYNLGFKQSRFPFLLFLHDDVKFHTENWGNNFISHLSEKKCGIIGVDGSNYVPSAPSGWFISKENKISVKNDKAIATVLDGVFLGIRKENFELLTFDENIPGFHGYDTDLSLRSAQIFTNYVISDIVIEHFSTGNPDKIWLKNNILIRKKLGSNFQKYYDKNLEYIAYENFMKFYFKYYPVKIKYIWETLSFLPPKLSGYDYLKIFILYLRFVKIKLSTKNA